MARRIPPLNPLHVFEVVARVENLTVAAQQLHVTQSAVSRQIAVLESYLGLELFRRERHGVSLTRAGKAYAEKVMPAFEIIAQATDDLTKDARQGVLRVRTYTTFAAKWLIPRLNQFHQEHPSIQVRISNAVPEVDFDRDAVDLAIQFGSGKWPRLQEDLLFYDEIEPVCSPAFLKKYAPNPKYPTSLLRQLQLVSQYRRTDWDVWLNAAGYADTHPAAEQMTFGSTILSWQAAMEGLGIAIGQEALLGQEFANGQLVRPFNQPILRSDGYYLVRPAMQRESRKVQAFRDWLMAQCQPIIAAQKASLHKTPAA